MKYTFETEDGEEVKHIMYAVEYRSFIWDLQQKIRDNLKYGKELTMDELYEELCGFDSKYPLY